MIRKKGGKCSERNSSEKSYALRQSVGHDEAWRRVVGEKRNVKNVDDIPGKKYFSNMFEYAAGWCVRIDTMWKLFTDVFHVWNNFTELGRGAFGNVLHAFPSMFSPTEKVERKDRTHILARRLYASSKRWRSKLFSLPKYFQSLWKFRRDSSLDSSERYKRINK